jgi:hypothetical protein
MKFRIDVIKFFFKRESFLKNEKSNTFDWLMDVSDKFNVKSSFYFIVNNSSIRYDYRYSLKSNFFNLIEKIRDRGHFCGIHYSYNSSKFNIIRSEWNKFFKIAMSKNCYINGGRMHYLRFQYPKTVFQLEETGQDFDESLTFFESGGFRCGTCSEFYPFDFYNFKEINIRIKPLVLMEASAFYYSGICLDEIKTYVLELIMQCYKVRGTFTMLWHNTELNYEQKKVYYSIVETLDKLKKQ